MCTTEEYSEALTVALEHRRGARFGYYDHQPDAEECAKVFEATVRREWEGDCFFCYVPLEEVERRCRGYPPKKTVIRGPR